jgi:hypothetical protein
VWHNLILIRVLYAVCAEKASCSERLEEAEAGGPPPYAEQLLSVRRLNSIDGPSLEKSRCIEMKRAFIVNHTQL